MTYKKIKAKFEKQAIIIEKMRSTLIWKYGYNFTHLVKVREMLKDPNITPYEKEWAKSESTWFRARALLEIELLHDWFDFNDRILEKALYKLFK